MGTISGTADVARATSGVEPTNWKTSATFPLVMLAIGIYFMVVVAVNLSGSLEPGEWLRVIAGWGASSSGHVPWSAPLLVTSVGALIAFSKSTAARDEVLGGALALAAQTLALGAALWTCTAIAAVTVPGVVDDSSERSQLWGVVFVAGPVIFVASLFAGRFPEIGPEKRLATACRTIAYLDKELAGMRSRAYVSWSLARARCSAWIPPLAMGSVATTALITELLSEQAKDPRFIATIVFLFSLTWGACALLVGGVRILWNQPVGKYWRWGRGVRRRLTPIGGWAMAGTAAAGSIFIALVLVLVLTLVTDFDSVETRAGYRLAAILVCGLIALSLAVSKGRHGRNAWATVGYHLRLRRRRALLDQVRKAQDEIDSRAKTTRLARYLRPLAQSRRSRHSSCGGTRRE